MVKILQGSAVTQTALGGLTIYLMVANFLPCICAKNYENWLAVDKVIAKIIWPRFLGPPCRYIMLLFYNYTHRLRKNSCQRRFQNCRHTSAYIPPQGRLQEGEVDAACVQFCSGGGSPPPGSLTLRYINLHFTYLRLLTRCQDLEDLSLPASKRRLFSIAYDMMNILAVSLLVALC